MANAWWIPPQVAESHFAQPAVPVREVEDDPTRISVRWWVLQINLSTVAPSSKVLTRMHSSEPGEGIAFV